MRLFLIGTAKRGSQPGFRPRREGNVLIVDTENHAIRLIEGHSGLIRTVAARERRAAPATMVPPRPHGSTGPMAVPPARTERSGLPIRTTIEFAAFRGSVCVPVLKRSGSLIESSPWSVCSRSRLSEFAR